LSKEKLAGVQDNHDADAEITGVLSGFENQPGTRRVSL
jgi:hypothetical protein